MLLLKKIRTALQVLAAAGPQGIRHVLVEKKRRSRATLDNCEFILRGLKDEGLRNGFLLGDYEQYERRAVAQYLVPELPVIELGACLGVVSCITNRRLQHPAQHIVVEANPAVIPFLQRNRRHNHCQFRVLNSAIAYDSDVIEYAPTENFAGNSLTQTSGLRKVRVPTISLQGIANRYGFDRFTLICDIEGHERELVERESEVLGRADLIILETHARLIGDAANAQLLARLQALGFELVEEESHVVVLRNMVSHNGALRNVVAAPS